MPMTEGVEEPRANMSRVGGRAIVAFAWVGAALSVVLLTTLISTARVEAAGPNKDGRGAWRAPGASDAGAGSLVPENLDGSIAGGPVNDLCANASVVTNGQTIFSTIGASTDGPEETGPACSGPGFSGYSQIGSDIWYEYAATCNGNVTVSLCGSGYDTKLGVYDVCNRCPPGTPAFLCSEDALAICGTRSQVTFPAVQNACYTIRIGGWLGAQGNGTMTISCSAPTGACCDGPSCLGTLSEPGCAAAGGVWHPGQVCPGFVCPVDPPPNDVCANAIEVFTNVAYNGTNAGATGSASSSCGFGDTTDVWHAWTADCTGLATFSLCGSPLDTTIAIYDECGGTELACNDDGCVPASTVDAAVINGQTYWIRVAGFRGAIGNYQLIAASCSQEPRACCGGPNNGICINTQPAQCVDLGGTPQAAGSVCLGDANGNNINDACELAPDPWIWLDNNGTTAGGYLPDFDQNQTFQPSIDGLTAAGADPYYSGPAAAADALFWFHGRYPTIGLVPPAFTVHETIAEIGLRSATNGVTPSPHGHPTPYAGTWPDDLALAAQAFLNDTIGPGLIGIRSVGAPTVADVTEPIMAGATALVRVGFHRVEAVDVIEGTGFVVHWRRVGGTYAAVAGVNLKDGQLALSDPDEDRAEHGAAGEVRGPDHNHDGDGAPGTTLPFRDAGYDHAVHDDVSRASHDFHDAVPCISSIGEIMLADAGDPLVYGSAQAAFHTGDAGGTFNLPQNFVTLSFLSNNGYADPAVGQIYSVIEDAMVLEPAAESACCRTNGTCFSVSPVACVNQGGTPRIAGSTCLGDGNANQVDDICDPCPAAAIVAVSPPDGTVDARQPGSPDILVPRLGIGSVPEPVTVTLDPPVPGVRHCFWLCETISDPVFGGNGIADVESSGSGAYRVTLDHAVAPGAVTTIEYEGDPGPAVAYTAHPGNVSGEGTAAEADLVELVSCCLLGSCAPAWGDFSCDLDRSGLTTPADLLRAADLLNGAGVFDEWNGSALPDPGGCP